MCVLVLCVVYCVMLYGVLCVCCLVFVCVCVCVVVYVCFVCDGLNYVVWPVFVL